MSVKPIRPTGREILFPEEDIIVSKTDLKGRIIYGNDVFITVSGFTENEFLGAPHNIIRHPDMPGCVFQLLWDTISKGNEIFAYVLNLCKNGDHYWVLAHVTPTLDQHGKIVGYHSNRRVPDRTAVDAIRPIYHELVEEERSHRNRRDGIQASLALLRDLLGQKNMSYDEFLWSLADSKPTRRAVGVLPC